MTLSNEGVEVYHRILPATKNWGVDTRTLNGIELGVIKDWDRATLDLKSDDELNFITLSINSGFSEKIDFIKNAECSQIWFDQYDGKQGQRSCGEKTQYPTHSARRLDKTDFGSSAANFCFNI